MSWIVLIIRLLTRRLGLLSPELQQQVHSLSLEQLEDLSEVLLDFTAIAELDRWLQNQR